MNSQPTIRPRLGLVIVFACSLFVVSTLPASAADASPIEDFGSKNAFKEGCEGTGGYFAEDGIGNTSCDWDDGSRVQCDANGNDCWYTPPPPITSLPSFPSIVIPPTDFVDTPSSGLLSAGDAGAPQTASLSRRAQTQDRLADDDSGKGTKKKRKKAKKAKRHDTKEARKARMVTAGGGTSRIRP